MKKYLLSLIGLILLLGCGEQTAVSPEATPPPTLSPFIGKLLFSSRRLDTNGDGLIQVPDAIHIYELDLASGRVTQLTQTDAYHTRPAWSPDGRFIAYLSTQSGNVDLFVMNADGSHDRQLTNDGQVSSLFWLNSSDEIAFSVITNEEEGWFLLDLESGNFEPIASAAVEPLRIRELGRYQVTVVEEADSSYLEVLVIHDQEFVGETAVYLDKDPFYESNPVIKP